MATYRVQPPDLFSAEGNYDALRGDRQHIFELKIKNFMETVTIPNREIATMAFDRLRRERKADAAIRLAGTLLHSQSICLGIGDTDWEIDIAIQCGGEPRTTYHGYSARFHFSRNTEMSEQRYNAIRNELYGE